MLREVFPIFHRDYDETSPRQTPVYYILFISVTFTTFGVHI